MRRLMVAGNWKMNGSRQMAAEHVPGYMTVAGDCTSEILVCPPFCLLADVEAYCSDSDLVLGGQDLAREADGAFTGEVSGAMLVDVGCSYVIVGHSERRTLFGESNDVVSEKVVLALECGLTPLICVGETLEQREREETGQVISAQLDAVESCIGIEGFGNTVLAYEPVWAIGTGMTATPAQAQSVHEFIRGRLAEKDRAVADRVRILYGGSVKPGNAAELFAQVDIDGGLIGGASLNPDDFVSICRAAG
jgi:triosephosphate isomerase